MEIVVDKELLELYFDLQKPTSKNETENRLISIINSVDNKIKISENYLEYLIKYFEGTNKLYKEYFELLVTDFYNTKKIISFKSEDGFTDEKEEITNCYNHNYSDFTFIINKSKKGFSEDINLSIYGETSLKSELIFEIASRQIISYNYIKLNNRQKINEFFKIFPNLLKNNKEVIIVDSYFNYAEINIFNSLKVNGIKYKCFKRKHDAENTSITRTNIKNFFGKKSTTVKFSIDKKIVHPRILLINNLSIELTHDFAEIKSDNKNWTIYLKLCEIKKNEILDNLSKYN